jgi:exoribonuclease R
MKNNLAFVLWGSEEPHFCSPNVQKKFVDGTAIELIFNIPQYLENKGWTFTDVNFTLVMESNGELLTSHHFQMENMQGNNIWVVANPEITEPNGSFTPVFARQFVLSASSGAKPITFRLFVNHGENEEEIADGTLIFDSDLGVSEYRKLMSLLENAQQSRQTANKAYRATEREQFVQKVAQEHTHNFFKVLFKNQNMEQTVYVICRNNSTQTDELLAVYPSAVETLNLTRGISYKILTHGQNESMKHAREMGNIDERYENDTIIVR